MLHAATTWIESEARPWFAWVHLFDPHAPYSAPAPFADGRSPYDGEIAWTDSALGAALAELERAGQLTRTLVIVTADHGESLGEHGESTHGLFAYDSTLRVPLIVAAPGIRARAVSTPASHVDIMPTILDLLGISLPDGLDGVSRRADLDGASSRASPIYFEALDANLTRGWAPLRGVVSSGWKYIDLPEPELYDLERDPAEGTNMAAREPRRVRELEAHVRQGQAASAPSVGRVVDAAEAEKLRSLGYVAGSSASAQRAFTAADDPKRLVALSEAFNTALDDYSRGRADEALQQLRRLLAERPDFLAARLSAAIILIGQGRASVAMPLLRAAPRFQHRGAAWLTRMGQALAATGDLQSARATLDAAAASARGDPEPLNELGVVLLRLGEHAEARRAFERLLRLDPTAAGTWYNLGLLEMDARRAAAAANAFRHVVDLDPQHTDGWRGLGAALVSSDPARAAEAWRTAVELDPRDADTRYNLRVLLDGMKRR